MRWPPGLWIPTLLRWCWHTNKRSSCNAFSEVSGGKKNIFEACPLLSLPISVQVPLETQELLDVPFVRHSSLTLPSTSVLKDSSLKWQTTVWTTSVWNMSLSHNGRWTQEPRLPCQCSNGQHGTTQHNVVLKPHLFSQKGQCGSGGAQLRVTGSCSITKHLFSAITCKDGESGVPLQTQRRLLCSCQKHCHLMLIQ